MYEVLICIGEGQYDSIHHATFDHISEFCPWGLLPTVVGMGAGGALFERSIPVAVTQRTPLKWPALETESGTAREREMEQRER